MNPFDFLSPLILPMFSEEFFRERQHVVLLVDNRFVRPEGVPGSAADTFPTEVDRVRQQGRPAGDHAESSRGVNPEHVLHPLTTGDRHPT